MGAPYPAIRPPVNVNSEARGSVEQRNTEGTIKAMKDAKIICFNVEVSARPPTSVLQVVSRPPNAR